MASSNPGSMFIAGGTDVVPNLKRRQFDVPALISLNALPRVKLIGGDGRRGLTIGAGVTLEELAHHPALGGPYRALAQACDLVSTPQVRYMGTLGGNLLVDPRCNYYNQTYSWRKAVGFCLKKDGDICLVARSSPRCWAVSSSDSAPVALALNATVTLHGAGGARRVRAHELYKDDGIDYTTKRADEVITSVDVPATEGRMTSAYWKLRRRPAFDFPIFGVAGALHLDRGMGGAAPRAPRAPGAPPARLTALPPPRTRRRPPGPLSAHAAETAGT